MGQHKFFSVGKLVIGEVGGDVPVGISHVAERLLKKEVKCAFVLYQILSFLRRW